MDSPGNSGFLYFTAITISIASISSGTCYSWTSPILPKLESFDSSINPISRPINTFEAGWIVAIINLGLLCGAIIPKLLLDRLGKKKTLMLGVSPFVVAHVMCIFASNIEAIFVARFLMGLAAGCLWSVAPVYVGELAEARNRGVLSSLIGVFSSIGCLLSYIFGPFLSLRWFSIVNLAPLVLFYVIMIMFVPDSPYDLIMFDKYGKAKASLIKLRGTNKVDKELSQIESFVNAAGSTPGSFFNMFRNKSHRRALGIGIGLLMGNQLSGILPVMGYTQNIFVLAGNATDPVYSSIMIGFIAFVSTLVNCQLCDRLGRKPLMSVSCIFLILSLFSLGAFFFMQDRGISTDKLSWLPLTSLVVFMCAYYVGLASIPFILLGELFPASIKSTATSFCASTNFFMSFLVTSCYPYLIDSIGMALTLWLFGCFMILLLVFCLTVVIETKGKTLEEIQKILDC